MCYLDEIEEYGTSFGSWWMFVLYVASVLAKIQFHQGVISHMDVVRRSGENKFSKSLMKKMFSVYFVLMSVWCWFQVVSGTLYIIHDERFIMCLI